MDLEKADDYREAVVFASSLVEQINKEDVRSMVKVQRDMLSRFEKTNEMLINFNLLSASRYEATVRDFQIHTQLLSDMKRDLDSIFKRIRVLKQRLSKAYPEAFVACSNIIVVDDDDEEADHTTHPKEDSGASTSKLPTPTVSHGKRDEGDGIPSPSGSQGKPQSSHHTRRKEPNKQHKTNSNQKTSSEGRQKNGQQTTDLRPSSASSGVPSAGVPSTGVPSPSRPRSSSDSAGSKSA